MSASTILLLSKQREIELDELPKPGEPLTHHIHEDNQRLLDEELAERAKRASATLTKSQLRKLNKRYKVLHKALNRARYNPLIQERWQVYQDFQRLKHEIKSVKGKKLAAMRAELTTAQQRGKALNAALAKLYPMADEFASLCNRLKAHADVLAFEREDAENKAAFRREAMVWEQQIKAVMRQSKRLHHAGTDSQGNYFCRIPEIEQIIFKDDKVLYQIRTTTQSIFERFLGRWHSALPYDVDINDLTCEETLENLSVGCNRVVTVERSKRGTNLFYVISRLDAPDGIPKRVLYSKVVKWYPVEQHSKTPWAAGQTEDRKGTFFNFEEQPHVLIAGSTQSGKSNHVNQMIATLVSMNTPAELRLLLIDLKGGIEFTHWTGLKHQLRPMVKSPDQVLEALKYIRAIMERRLAAFEAAKAKNLATYNQKVKDKLPRVVTFVDEMATLVGLGELTTEIHNELRVISSQGRAVGVHLVLCTQHASVDVLPGWVKTNMSLRISGKMPSASASMIILDTVTAATLPPIPGRLAFSIGRSEILAQSPFISDAEIAEAVKISRDFPDADNSEFTDAQPIIVVREKFTEHDAIELALNLFGGKLSPTRLHGELGNDVISERKLRDMVDDIIDRVKVEGLEHDGQQYKIRKDRKSWVLEPIGQAVGQNSEGDTEELKPLDYPIDEVTE